MPSLVPLLDAPLAVQIHVGAALLAIALLPWSLFRRRKDRIHRMAGYAWVSAMALAAMSSFFIHGIGLIGPFSPIHLISVATLFGLYRAVRAAIDKNFAAHRLAMRSTVFGALGVAGFLALIPGRLMNEVLFGPYGAEGSAFLAVLVALAAFLHRRGKLRGAS